MRGYDTWKALTSGSGRVVAALVVHGRWNRTSMPEACAICRTITGITKTVSQCSGGFGPPSHENGGTDRRRVPAENASAKGGAQALMALSPTAGK